MGIAKQSVLRIWGAELIKTSFEEQKDAPNVSSMMGMQVFMLSLSRCRLHGSPQMLFLLTFPSFPTLYVHIFHIMLIILNPCILFYYSRSSFHYVDIMFLRNLENKLFLSLSSLFSVGTTAAQSAAGSVTPWTQMTSTPARPLAPTSTPHLSHTET